MSTEPRTRDADTWLPHMLDPTPTELLDLFEFCRGLAEALRQYEQHVAGHSLETVCIQRAINPFADAWRHLLDALERLGSWGTGCEPLAFDESPDFFEDIAGWTKPECLEDHFPIVQAIYSEIVSQLVESDLIADRSALVECAIRWASAGNEEAAFAWYTRESFERIADDMARSVRQGGTIASTMLGESAANVIADPEYNIDRLRGIQPDWRQRGGVCREAILVAEERKRLTLEGIIPSNLPVHYTHWDRVVRSGETFPSLTFPVEEEGEDSADALETAADMMESVFDEFCERVVTDGTGRRRLAIDPQELPRYRGCSQFETGDSAYPASIYYRDPFARTLEIESLTGARLRDGLSPLWFVNLFEEYKCVIAREGEFASFAQYATRRFPVYVFRDVSDTENAERADAQLQTPDCRGGTVHRARGGAVPHVEGTGTPTSEDLCDGDPANHVAQLGALKDKLASMPHGRPEARAYEDLVGDVIKLCFSRSLKNVEPRRPSYTRHVIRDWIAANRADQGFWQMVRQNWHATQIIWECKNYETLRPRDFQQIAYYLNDLIGRFAIVTFRGKITEKCWNHLKEIAQNNRSVVLLLNDEDLNLIIEDAAAGGVAELPLQSRYDETIRNVS